ncbi:MAG: polysaccharide deacetylase family protein [Elusimicrobia bacterium]|nr:polysaccharide deacetylase family protein [Elusimicrobiota bacterium]
MILKKTPLLLIAFAAVSALGALAYGLADPQATLLGPALVSAGAGKRVALTFDDGPSEYTAGVLDVLKARGVHATFFVCGENAERRPDLVRRIRAEGHELGNHTWSHPYLHLKSKQAIAGEIDRTQDAVERISGVRPTLFRPPFGVRWFGLWDLLRERGMTMALWSIRPYDGRYKAPEIEKATLSALAPGAIILLHDGFETHLPAETDRSEMLRALPAIIDGVRHAGYDFGELR